MEGGGVGLNRMSGIGSAQQSAGASEVMASSSANRTTKLDAGSAALQDVGSEAPVDQASLSTASGAVMQALLGSDVRGDKVAALQQTIAAGTYNVAASDVAAKIMSALME
jgi:anti-sigma28 factor (negative regulator of flagellin synthesis)